jgi:tRNA-(ms[2]io[6]A)-hydroxylase
MGGSGSRSPLPLIASFASPEAVAGEDAEVHGDEARVLEPGERSEVGRDGQRQREPALRRTARARSTPEDPVGRDRAEEERQPAGLAPGVEGEARGEQRRVADAARGDGVGPGMSVDASAGGVEGHVACGLSRPAAGAGVYRQRGGLDVALSPDVDTGPPACDATSRHMSVLASRTDPAWTARALESLDDVLVDHAHCEKKAASTALSLCFRYPDRPELSLALSALAREELAHFEQVVELLQARGIAPRHQVPSPYAAGLLDAVRTTEPERLLDTLLCMALIEARSCERLRLLGDALDDAELASLYRGLVTAEGRHQRRYVELAKTVAPAVEVRARLDELARHEAAVLRGVPAMARLHA